jgi:hypothetical protein
MLRFGAGQEDVIVKVGHGPVQVLLVEEEALDAHPLQRFHPGVLQDFPFFKIGKVSDFPLLPSLTLRCTAKVILSSTIIHLEKDGLIGGVILFGSGTPQNFQVVAEEMLPQVGNVQGSPLEAGVCLKRLIGMKPENLKRKDS